MKLIIEKCGEEFGEENCGEERAALLAIHSCGAPEFVLSLVGPIPVPSAHRPYADRMLTLYPLVFLRVLQLKQKIVISCFSLANTFKGLMRRCDLIPSGSHR
jgi:hypothetical protein